MPRLAKIFIHPVKSFDPQSVERAVLQSSGALQHDRRFVLRDREGVFINAKRTPAVHHLRTHFDPATNRLTVRVGGLNESCDFDVATERGELSAWLGDYFGMPLELVEDRIGGFPDDLESPGPTVVSTATLTEVATWFKGLYQEEVRARFRANLEIDGVEAFWEDRLVAEGDRVVRFRIGEAELLGTNPCQRCPVPTRDTQTGETTREFSKTFARRRQEMLPPWAPAGRFDHFYRLAVNTRPVGARDCELHVGDEVQILGVE